MKKTIIIILLSTLLAVALAGCGGEGDDEQTVVEDVTIMVMVDPDPPAVGDTMLMVSVTDVDGNAITDASVYVYGNMDHEGMEPEEGNADMSMNDMYHVPFHWSMGGGWILDVTVTLPDDRGVAKDTFEFFVEAVSADSVINQGAEHEHEDATEESDASD